MRYTEELLNKYLDTIVDEDDVRRLLRLSFLDNNRFRSIMDALIEGSIDLKDIDNLDLVNTRGVDEFISVLDYMNMNISHPDTAATNYIMETLGFKHLLNSLKVSHTLIKEFNKHKSHSYTLNINVGDNENIDGYETIETFNKESDKVYRETLDEVPITTFNTGEELKEYLYRSIELNSIDSIVYDEVYHHKFIENVLSILAGIPNGPSGYRETFFKYNNVFISNLERHANEGNLILNYSPLNKYTIYYINQIIDRYSSGDLNPTKIYDWLMTFDFGKEHNLHKSITKFYVYAYLLYSMEPKFNFPLMRATDLLEYMETYREFIFTFNKKAYSSLITS